MVSGSSSGRVARTAQHTDICRHYLSLLERELSPDRSSPAPLQAQTCSTCCAQPPCPSSPSARPSRTRMPAACW
jgi:hypothetical protein